MKLIVPNNIFSTLLILSLDENKRPDLEVKESSLISVDITNNNDGVVGLIPTLDIINNRDLFVSSKVGICFDGPLSNTYMYFGKDKKLEQFLLRGDISINEVVLAKIVMQERYGISPDFTLDTDDEIDENKNYLISGNSNWKNKLHEKGISFSEQVSELIDIPYQNFVFASQDKKAIEEINAMFKNPNKKIAEQLEILLAKINFSEDVNELVRHELEAIYYNTKVFENESVNELLKLCYYHQIIGDMFDVKFVE